MEYFLIGLAMSLLVAVVLGLIVAYSLCMERLAARRPKSSPEPEEATHAAPSRIVSRPLGDTPAPSITDLISSFIMSRFLGAAGPIEGAGNGVAQAAPEAGQGVAKPGNPVNDGLPGNVLPEEVREIMRFQAKVEAVENILKSGKIGQVEAIEFVFECKRSGRPESVYARAVAAVKARSETAYRANQARLVELVAAHEKDL